MREVQLREAKASFSALVEAAERGEATLVTKRGKPAAMLVPVEDARRIYPVDQPNFADALMAIPHELPIRRSRSRARPVRF